MFSIAYQSYGNTVWEVNEGVMEQLMSEGFVKWPKDDNTTTISNSFEDTWGSKTYEAFCITVALLQAEQALEEGDYKNLRDNHTDAIVVLKGGRV